MTCDQFCLKWNNYQTSMIQAFDCLKLAEELVDVSLYSGEGRRIKAHKIILSACSRYFTQIFKENPSEHPIVILKDVRYCDLENIVKYMYAGQVFIKQDHLGRFLKTAEALEVKGLAQHPYISSNSGEQEEKDQQKSVGTSTWSKGQSEKDESGSQESGFKKEKTIIDFSLASSVAPHSFPLSHFLSLSPLTLPHLLPYHNLQPSPPPSISPISTQSHPSPPKQQQQPNPWSSLIKVPTPPTPSYSMKRTSPSSLVNYMSGVTHQAADSRPLSVLVHRGNDVNGACFSAAEVGGDMTRSNEKRRKKSENLTINDNNNAETHNTTGQLQQYSNKNMTSLHSHSPTPSHSSCSESGRINQEGEETDEDSGGEDLVIEEIAGSGLGKENEKANEEVKNVLIGDRTLIEQHNHKHQHMQLQLQQQQKQSLQGQEKLVQQQQHLQLTYNTPPPTVRVCQTKLQKHINNNISKNTNLDGPTTPQVGLASSILPANNLSGNSSHDKKSVVIPPTKHEESDLNVVSSQNNLTNTLSHPRNRWRCMQPRVCNYCWKTFSNSFNLKQHIVNVHVESEGVTCNVCEKVVKNKWYLRKHLVTAHGAPLKRSAKNCGNSTIGAITIPVQQGLEDRLSGTGKIGYRVCPNTMKRVHETPGGNNNAVQRIEEEEDDEEADGDDGEQLMIYQQEVEEDDESINVSD